MGRLRPLPGFPDAAKLGNSSAEQDSLDRALIALSRKKILQSQSSMNAFLQGLISKGVNVNAQDEKGLIALHWASREGHLALVKFLCERGVDINLKSNKGQSALDEVIAKGHTFVTKFLLKREAVDVEQNDRYGQTPLMCAAHHRRVTMLDALLKSNADLDAKGEEGNTALHLAARKGHNDCVKLLLEAGALLEARDCKDSTALMKGSYYGHVETIKLLLKAGARPDYKRSPDGYGPLHFSAKQVHSDCTTLLLDAGAPIKGRNSHGYTALMIASQRGPGEVVELLLKAGAKVDAQNNGSSSLMCAASSGHREVIDRLLAAGAQIRARGREGETALLPVFDRHPDDCKQSECSFCSGRETRKDITKYSCEKGADVSAVDDSGELLLEYIRRCDHIDQDERKCDQGDIERIWSKNWFMGITNYVSLIPWYYGFYNFFTYQFLNHTLEVSSKSKTCTLKVQ